MPRPRAPTRELFQCTNRRRSGGKCVLYRCKRCGREMLENTHRFAVHVTVCKKATEKDRAIAIGQLLKTKKYGSTTNNNEDDLMKKPTAARQQQQQQQEQSSQSPAAIIITEQEAVAMASEHHLMTRAKVPKMKNENLVSPRAHYSFQEEELIPRSDKSTPPHYYCLDDDQQQQQETITVNRPNNNPTAAQQMRQHYLLPHNNPSSDDVTTTADARLEANRNTAGASLVGTIDFDMMGHLHTATSPIMFPLDTLLVHQDYHSADLIEHQSATASIVEMGSDAVLCDNQSAYWGGGVQQDPSLLSTYFYERNHQFYPPAYSWYSGYQPVASYRGRAT